MDANFKFQKDKLLIFGIWDKTSVAKLKIHNFLSQISNANYIFDFSNLEKIDMAGVRFFLALEFDLKKNNITISKQGLNSRFQKLFQLCEKNYQRIDNNVQKNKISFKELFTSLGILIINFLIILRDFINFIGAFFISLLLCFKNPKNFRFVSFLYHIENSAFNALPIVILTAFLIGVVLAYQAAYQLAQFGANIFIVDLIGISATRELAPLITAIIIAGRSASSYTAQIGVMKITDEIAAMNTMGFRSFDFIIIPRVIALIISMPLIVALSDAISILGGMIVAKINLDISFSEFIRRFKEAVELKHIIIGLAKAPMFGFLIGSIACFNGFKVKNTTQSIGIYTTKSVVSTIFWVIAFDALFSIILTMAGI
ncbi:ABC transporter permease [Campylobacter estrildidarum]|uniref:ABC transporter permease n=1 Tax=Campylobacter estrildidarum TaxID=2510189 RepID=A0A4U7BN14_9BACT|nr:ABC transporter permease [Campylobacter estrildidarum]TKX31600.1 ABC transporter permease [Campylobacter estrildidarum]